MTEQPETTTLTQDGITFRDLNKNGRLDPYEDARRPIEERVEDLLSQMTLEEKAGLMFHTMIGMNPDGDLDKQVGPFPMPARVRIGGRAEDEPLQRVPDARRPADGRVAQPAAEAGRGHPPGHPGHHLLRPAPCLHPQRGAGLGDRRLLAVARADWAGCHRRSRPGAGVRRYRPPGIPGGRHPHRAAPHGRPGHRAALGAHQRHLWRRRRSSPPA